MNGNKGLKRALCAAALIAIAAPLAACGKQGVLERPAPLFGTRARTDYEAERAQEASDEAQRAALRPGPIQDGPRTDNVPAPTRAVQDPAQRLSPASSSPVSGAPNPIGAPISTRP